MGTSKSKKADAAQAVLDANHEVLVGFDAKKVTDCLVSMARSKAEADAAGETKSEAAHKLIVHAYDVAQQSRAAGATDIDKGWSKNLKALYPKLVKDGVSFIKTETKKDGGTSFTLSGYGQNVNSVARGFCQYADIAPDAEGRIAEDRKIVEARRAEDLSEDEQLLRAAKEALDVAIKTFRKAAIKGGDYSVIEGYAGQLVTWAEVIEQADADAEAIEEEAEAAEAVAS